MLSAEEIERFERDGYLKGDSVLSDEQVEELRDEMARVVRDVENPDVPQPVSCRNLSGDVEKPVWQIVNIWQASDAFARLIHNRVISEEIAQLTGAQTLRIWHDQIQYKPASTGGVNMWHQDAPLWPVLQPMTQVSAWVALDDVDEANGCMSMVPGSHKWGNHIAMLNGLQDFAALPDEWQGHDIEVRPCPVRKGEVHYHHALTWHGSPANTSSRPRRAIALHYMTEETRFVEGGEHLMKPLITVRDGEVVQGQHFPMLWQNVPVDTIA